MRCLSFLAIGALNVQSIALNEGADDGRAPAQQPTMDAGPEDPDTTFYEKAVLVLFDLPDFMIISAYVLLVCFCPCPIIPCATPDSLTNDPGVDGKEPCACMSYHIMCNEGPTIH